MKGREPQMDANEIKTLAKENETVEYKSAKGGFPKSFWETFSAFANTNGGVIILGVKETNGRYVADGLTEGQIQDYKKKFWDDAHNKNCVSVPLLVEDDVEAVTLQDGSFLLVFRVPRAAYNLRPVYLTTNPIGHTYRRRHEGDYVCSDDEVRQMFSDANHLRSSADARILRNYTMDDIDMATLRNYRQVYDSRHEGHPWSEVDDKTFLENIGAYRKDRVASQEGFTVAGILMFGKTASITDQECLPWFFPDYRERLSIDPGIRWTDRIYPDGTWEANLYQFFSRVLPRLYHALPTPFMLSADGVTRQEYTSAHTALREALANALIHASYTMMGNITIDRYSNKIVISNPGSMLVSVDEFYAGGYSICRNPILQKMFVLIGVGEKAGSGADTILKGWKDNDWQAPAIAEKQHPDRVETTLWVDSNATTTSATPTSTSTIPTKSETAIDTIQKAIQKDFGTIQKDFDTIQKSIQKSLRDSSIELTESQIHILAYFLLHPDATRKQYLAFNPKATEGGAISNIARLQKLGLLRREGGRKKGHWVVTIKTLGQDETD